MFHVFRRHQKRWLTALTILAMIGFAFPLGSTYFGRSSGSRARSGPEVVDTMYGHRVTSDDLVRARLERHVANTFFQVMVSTVRPELSGRLGELFGPTRDDESIKDAIRLSYKADQLGVRVSDDMVRTWINRMTDGKLTNAQFDRVVATVGRVAPQLTGESGMSSEVLFDILKKQLRIENVRELMTGRYGDFSSPVTPYECWQFYQKMNDKLGLEVIPVNVVDFTIQIDDPGDSVLRELYNNYIGQLPDPASPEPGFKEPHRVNLQYASVSLKDFALATRPELEVSDEEIKQYYDSHKDLYRIRPAAPTLAPAKPAIEPAETPQDKKEEPDATKEPDTKPQGTEEKKAEPKSPPPSEDKPDDPNSDGSDSNAPGGPRVTITAQGDAAPGQDSSQQATDEKPAQESKASEKQNQDKSDQAEGKQEDKKESDDKKDDESKSDEKKEDAAQYKPVEEVTDEIRDILIKDKARAEILKRLGQIDAKVIEYAKVFLLAKDKFDEEKQTNPRLEFVPPQAPDFSKLADELGLKLSETGLTALDEEPFKISNIGQAIQLDSGRVRVRSVADSMGSAEFFEPHQFQNFVTEEFFSAWKIGDQEEREPDFQEIRDRVLLAFRMMKARDRAEQRANEIAASLRDVQGDMEKFRAKEGGIESISIAPMSLWSNAPMYSLQMMQRGGRVPAEIPGLQLPSDELRNKTFELKEREVTVAPNQPKSIYYVVLLTKREPASREDFARSRQFIENQVRVELAEKIDADWRAELRREASGKVAAVPRGN